MEAIERRKAKPAAPLLVPPIDQWIASDVSIEEPQGDSVSIIPFRLWPKQLEALSVITAKSQVIILKARQLGISWLVIAYAVWLCIYHPNKLVMVFSKDQDSANEMIRRAKGIFQRLKHQPAELSIDNVTTIGWSNGSRIKSFAATEDAGSSYTASLTIIDEFAKMRYAEALYTSVKPTIADGGKMIVISTARGEGNPFHQLWQNAVKHLNSFVTLFLDWRARPDRTDEWYTRQEADAISSAHHRQEYPATPDEAFVSIGEDRFLSSMILWDSCQETLPALQHDEPLIIAIDAGVSNDSFGMVGVTKHPARQGDYAIRLMHEWIPPQGGKIDFRGNSDAPGPDWLIRNVYAQNYALVEVVYDPYQLESLCADLMRDGVVACIPFSQAKDRLEADKFFYDAILARRIAHDGNEAMRRHIDNSNRKVDAESHKLRIVKRTESGKIDLAVSCSMALLSLYKMGL